MNSEGPRYGIVYQDNAGAPAWGLRDYKTGEMVGWYQTRAEASSNVPGPLIYNPESPIPFPRTFADTYRNCLTCGSATDELDNIHPSCDDCFASEPVIE